MSLASRVVFLLAVAAVATPALADDCAAAAKNAMLNSGLTPRSLISTSTDAQGKPSVTRQVQTEADKFVQLPNGQWYSMGIAIKDLTDDTKTAKITCQSSGSDVVNGSPAVVYLVHIEDEGSVVDDKMWISSKSLVLKSETNQQGAHITTLYDYDHIVPPANYKSMGRK